MPRSLLALVFLGFAATASAQLVAPTGPLTPAEQQKKFKLPEGFEIQLVACEPDVHKPMNLKFDVRGRLWVTHSLEYPFPAKEGTKPRDMITIFSELDETGRAKKVQNFATELNIPIGVLPLGDASAIAWSIPNLFRFTDTNNDGAADEKKIAYGPFGFTDTHGNQNGLTRWLDGWVYACHGFSNNSQVKIGGEGEVVMQLNSGNTYRFRPDGSAIEQVSWGQVNPFGLGFDPLGNMFTADCHSRPITMILRGGYYQSFGKPHDGLGYAPEATAADHGGTGIAGAVYYAAEQFPANYRDVLFVGNVITNRVHCDRIKWNGSTPWIDKPEDFLTCDDPWFRPVDLQLGPDGALYVLDFYNKIIGHYEVPLTHPERDRERGRVWRIVYKGKSDKLPPLPNLREMSAEKLADALGDKNMTVRMLATNELLDRFPKDAEHIGRELVEKSKSREQQAHGLWIVARTSGISGEMAENAYKSGDRLVRVHLLQALAEAKDWNAVQLKVVQQGLSERDPMVRRNAVQATARHADYAENIPALCTILRETPEDDTQLKHAAKIALRNHLRSEKVGADLANLKLDAKHLKQVIGIAALAPQGPAGSLIYEAALRGEVDDELLAKALPSAARYIDVAKAEDLIKFIKKRYANDSAARLLVLRGMHEGLTQRGIAAPEILRTELTELVRNALAGDKDSLWINLPVPGAAPSRSPWVLQPRKFADDKNDIPVVSSLTTNGGEAEKLTGILRSPKFTLSKKLTFWMCGHNGFPTTADAQKNFARLVLVDGTEVAKSYPPRNDIAQKFEWDLAEHAGKQGYFEVVDNHTGDAYAWIAVSRFDPPVIKLPEGAVGDYETARAELFRLAGQLKLTPLAGQIASTASSADQTVPVRLAACDALVSLEPKEAIAPLSFLLSSPVSRSAERQQAAEILGRIDRPDAHTALVKQLKTAPREVAVAIATALAAKNETGTLLLKEVSEGRASAALLKEPTVLARLQKAKIDKLDEQIQSLTARLSPADDRIAALIKTRREKFLALKDADLDKGKAIFAKSECAKCHKIGETGETGATLAPALDGIGVRGLDRLLEDILDPSRNVDQAFRVTAVETSDGQIINGFGAREEGKTLVLFDAQGKAVRIPTDSIAERTQLPLSPMPSNLSEQLPEADFYPLLAYLLSQKAKVEEK
jgi:putative heme-binding domain-containing protein